MAHEDFEMAIQIRTKAKGGQYSQPVLDTKLMPVQKALDQANEVIEKKFGSGTSLTLTRPRRRRERN